MIHTYNNGKTACKMEKRAVTQVQIKTKTIKKQEVQRKKKLVEEKKRAHNKV